MSVVAVTGGTGVLGQRVVGLLEDRGHEVRVISRRTGFDLTKRDDASAAVSGADYVVHAASATRRFGRSDPEQTSNLVAAGGRVRHLVYVSIVGIDAIPYRYYRRKLACERIVEGSGVAHTILRATQFHELVAGVLSGLARLPFVPLPLDLKAQPVAAGEVAGRCVDLLEGPPRGRAPDFGGPEILTLREAIELWPARIRAAPLPPAGRVLRAFAAGLNTTLEEPRGVQTWAEYLATR